MERPYFIKCVARCQIIVTPTQKTSKFNWQVFRWRARPHLLLYKKFIQFTINTCDYGAPGDYSCSVAIRVLYRDGFFHMAVARRIHHTSKWMTPRHQKYYGPLICERASNDALALLEFPHIHIIAYLNWKREKYIVLVLHSRFVVALKSCFYVVLLLYPLH